MTDNRKYIKRGQALIIRDDPQRYEEVAGANKNKEGGDYATDYPQQQYCNNSQRKIITK